MFEVGKHYTITMIEFTSGGPFAETYHDCEVVNVDMPLITYRWSDAEHTVNTKSPMFGSATPVNRD
jgi:hypothetical protein